MEGGGGVWFIEFRGLRFIEFKVWDLGGGGGGG